MKKIIWFDYYQIQIIQKSITYFLDNQKRLQKKDIMDDHWDVLYHVTIKHKKNDLLML